MSHRAIRALVAGSLGFVATTVSAADQSAGGPDQQEMKRQIEALRAQVERLEAQQRQQEDKLTAREVDATVADVLREADRRSHLLQAQGFTAGYDKGKFLIQSEDGNFVLNPNFQFQARYVLNYRDEDAPDPVNGDATTESGFEMRRMKIAFEGNVFGPATTYKFQWATNRNGGNLVLEEAFVRHKLNFAPDLSVKLGQYKDPTFHEEITSSKRQLAVDRSLANEVLAGGVTDFIQGVALIWDDGPEGLPFRAEIGYTDGPNSDNTGFVDAGGSGQFGVADPDFGVHGRAEYFAFGDPRNYDDFSAMGNIQDLLVFGAGAFYAQAGGDNALFHTFDAQYEVNRLGLYAAYYGVYSDGGGADDDDEDDGGGEGSAYDLGGVAQAGYMLTDKWEVFGRYSLVALDTAADEDDDNYHELTAGLNYFLRGHAAKLTADVIYLPNGVPTDQSGLGELDPDADEDTDRRPRQFQLCVGQPTGAFRSLHLHAERADRPTPVGSSRLRFSQR
jgi:hypothetical protein